MSSKCLPVEKLKRQKGFPPLHLFDCRNLLVRIRLITNNFLGSYGRIGITHIAEFAHIRDPT